MIGALIGTHWLQKLPTHILAHAFAALLLASAARLLLDNSDATGRGPLKIVAVVGLVALGLASGTLAGLLGVGGGVLMVPAMIIAFGIPAAVAKGTSLAVIVGNSAVALAFRGTGAVDWSVALPFTITMLAGTAAGALVASRLPARRALHAFAVLLVAVALANGAAAIVAVVG